MVSTRGFDPRNPGSSPGGTFFFLFLGSGLGLAYSVHPDNGLAAAPRLTNAITASLSHHQRISSPSPVGISRQSVDGRQSSPVAAVDVNNQHMQHLQRSNVVVSPTHPLSRPNHLTHYSPASRHPQTVGFDHNTAAVAMIEQQQEVPETSWDQNHHQPHQVGHPAHGSHHVVIGSSHTGTLPRNRSAGSKPPAVVIRKSPENSNSSSGSGSHLSNSGPNVGGGGGTGGGGGIAADSGFNSETKDMMIPMSTNGIPATLVRCVII